jgi:hypothetical protein
MNTAGTPTVNRPRMDGLTNEEAERVAPFGFCPECLKPPTGDGLCRANAYFAHLQWCDECRTYWSLSTGRFSPVREEQTEGEWAENGRKLGEGGYREVQPAWVGAQPEEAQ